MTALVVDASVAIKWLIGEDGSDAAERLLVQPLEFHAPELLKSEVASALWKNIIRGYFGLAEADAALGVLHRSVSAWHSTSDLIAEALSLACELNHPVYDCHYLVLARQLETKCITADERLLAKAGATGLIAGLADWKM